MSLTKSTGRSTAGSTGGGSFGLPSPARNAGTASAHASSAPHLIWPESDIHSRFMALRESNSRTASQPAASGTGILLLHPGMCSVQLRGGTHRRPPSFVRRQQCNCCDVKWLKQRRESLRPTIDQAKDDFVIPR